MSLYIKKAVIILLVVFILFDLGLGFYYLFSKQTKNFIGFLKQLRPGSCLILEEKYCKNAVRLNYNDRVVLAGFSLPSNTPIFLPYDAVINLTSAGFKKDKKVFSYPSLQLIKEGGASNQPLIAVIFNDKDLPELEKTGVKNQEIYQLTNTPVDFFGKYNLVVYFLRTSDDGRLTNDNGATIKTFGL